MTRAACWTVFDFLAGLVHRPVLGVLQRPGDARERGLPLRRESHEPPVRSSAAPRSGHLWSTPPDSHGRSTCLRCRWWRLRVANHPSLFNLSRSLKGTWSGAQPDCDPELAAELRRKLGIGEFGAGVGVEE